MLMLTIDTQIDGHSWTATSGALQVLNPLHDGAFDLSASLRANGYTSAL